MRADHDAGYKQLFSHPELLRELLRAFVPQPWTRQLELSAFERLNASYVGQAGKQRHDDMVWRIGLGAGQACLYLLLEFQSRPDPWMALRMQVYSGLLYQDLVRQRRIRPRSRRGLPPVLPLVLYDGKPRWTASTSLAALRSAFPEGLAPFQLEQNYLLIDLTRYRELPPETQDNLVTLLFRLTHAGSAFEMPQLLATFSARLAEWPQQSLRDELVRWVVMRLRGRFGDIGDAAIPLLEELDIMFREKITTFEEALRQETLDQGMQLGLEKGRQEGRQEGRQAGLQEGLQKGLQKGSVAGLREALGRIVRRRQGVLAPQVAARIAAADSAQLMQWLDLLTDGVGVEQVFAAP